MTPDLSEEDLNFGSRGRNNKESYTKYRIKEIYLRTEKNCKHRYLKGDAIFKYIFIFFVALITTNCGFVPLYKNKTNGDI